MENEEQEQQEEKKPEIDPVFIQLIRMLVTQNHACSVYLDFTRKRVSVILDTLKNMQTVLSLGKNNEEFKDQTQEYEFFAKDVIDNLNNLEKIVILSNQ